MIGISKVISSSFDEAKRLVVKVLYRGKIVNGIGDVRTPIEASPFGVDSNPTAGKIAIYAQTGVNGKYYIVGYLNTKRLAEVGETRLFSTDANGNIQAYVWLKNNGQILELNGDQNYAVKFNELKVAFDQLKADHNALVNLFNAHTHPVTGAVLAAPPVPALATTILTPANPNTSNIDEAKNEKIRTNS